MKLIPTDIATLLYTILRIVVVAYVILILAILFFQERLIFHPSPFQGYRFDRDFEQIRIAMDDGSKLNSLLFKSPNSKGTILFFHGNAGSLDNWGRVAAEMASRTSWSVWIIDYPGFGESDGTIRSENQLHQMAQVFWQNARAKLGNRERLVVLGRSIGSGIGLKLASEQKIAGLILETPYLSLKSLAQAIFPWAPTFVLRYPLRSDLWIQKVKAPILILHGDHDEVIPFAQGQALAKLKPSATFTAVPGGHHNDLDSYDAYWTGLKNFLEHLE